MGHTKETADDAPYFGEKKDRKNPDFSIVDIYAEEEGVWIQTGGMHEPYSVEIAEQIRDRLDSAIEEAKMTGESVVQAVEVMEAIGADVPNEYTLGDVDDLAYPVKYNDLKLTIGDKVVYDDSMRVYETTPVFHPEDQAEYEVDQFDLNSLGIEYGTDVAGYDPDTFPFLLMVTIEKYVGSKVLYVVSRDGTIACLDPPSIDVVEDGIDEIIESIHRTKPEGPTFINDANLPSAEVTVESVCDL